jgi:hypothetical protein
MTDPAQTPQVAPTTSATPAAGGAGQSPLDVLDQILKDAQSKAKEAVEEKAEEDAKRVEEERRRQRELDQQRIAEELMNLEKVKETPQYHAMVEQRQEEIDKEEQHKQQMDGMEIIQLKHDKQ